MMIAQIMQRLFGPVFQGVGPITEVAQGGDQAGAFTGLMAEGDDSPLNTDGAGDASAVMQTAHESALPSNAATAMMPAQNAIAGQREGSPEKPKVEPAQKPIARIMLGSALTAQQIDAPPALGASASETAVEAAKQDRTGAQVDEGAGTARIMLGQDDGRKGAVVLEAGLLAPRSTPDMVANTGSALPDKTAWPQARAGLSGLGEPAANVVHGQGVSNPQNAGNQASRNLAASTAPMAALNQSAQRPSIAVQELASLGVTQTGLAPEIQASRMVAADGLMAQGGGAAMPMQSITPPDVSLQKAPSPMGAVAALQAFVQGGARGVSNVGPEVLQDGLVDSDIAVDPIALDSPAARRTAAIYALPTQNGVQMPVMLPAGLAGQWAGVDQDALNMELGESGLAGFGLGDGRSGMPSLSSVAAPASSFLAGHTPTAAQLSAQILPLAQAAQSGPVELVLSPAELGQLRFEIHHRGDQVQIVLSAERPETLDLLRRNSEQLLSDFRNAGFEGASLSFGHWGAGQNANTNPQGFESDAQSEAGSAPSMAASPSAQGARFVPPSTYLDPSRSLNLRL